MRVEVVSALPHGSVTCAAFSRRAKSVFVGSPYEVLPLETCFEQLPSTSSLASCSSISCIALSNDERNIGVASGALLKIIDVATGRELRNLSGHTLPIASTASGKSSVYSWYTGSMDFSWSQWDTRMHPSKVLNARTAGPVRSVATSPGDRFVAVGCDSSIQLFDVRQRAYVKHFNCSGRKLEFNPTEVLLSAVGADNVVRFICLEKFDIVSQSDAFIDDIQASVFDTHLMVTATNDSLQLLTWEPCDMLARIPLRGIERVIDVSINDDEISLICIGETTERVDMRTYSIEEILQASSANESGGDAAKVGDYSPMEEEKGFFDGTSPSHSTSPDLSSSEMRTSGSGGDAEEASASTASTESTSPPCSSNSSPTTRARAMQSTARASSQRATSTTKSARVSQRVPPKPPAAAATRASSAATRLVRPRPSPSLSELNKERKPSALLRQESTTNLNLNLGSTQSLSNDKEAKKRSASLKRSEISITYLGRPRSPSENDFHAPPPMPPGAVDENRSKRSSAFKNSSKTATTTGPATVDGDKKKLTTRAQSPAATCNPSQPSHARATRSSSAAVTPTSPSKKVVVKLKANKASEEIESGSLNSWDDLCSALAKGHEQIIFVSQQRLADWRELRNFVRMRGAQSLFSQELAHNESLARAAIRQFNEERDWSLNACRVFLPVVKENLVGDDDLLRNEALDALQQMALGVAEKLRKFASSTTRIGVDVAAEERAEKAKFCIEELRELCAKRDWYYRHLGADEIERLDAVLGVAKHL